NASDMSIFSMESLGVIFPVIAWAASVFTFIYCMIIIFKTFTGKYKPKKLEKAAREAPVGMLVPPLILSSLVIIIFFFPNVLSQYILKPAMGAVLPAYSQPGEIEIKISAWHGWNA